MNVLHVTEELSKKNYSISSLIFFLSSFISKKINFNFNVLTSAIQEDVFKKNSNIKIVNYSTGKDIFDNNNLLSEVIKKYDVIHVHGIWRAINLLSIFSCINLNKNFYIHPHGMMLDAALKNKGVLNYYLKILFLNLFNFIYGNRLNFISITELETLSINKFFPKSKIYSIPNPVPIGEQIFIDFNYKKNFVFFGRFHPIKNIHLVIEGFIKANLSDEWKLEIYGIPDDEEYFDSLKKLASNKNNIIFNDPIFGIDKINTLKSSWCNILLSDSEVLSLSVLESASLQLPSLVNKEIQIDEYAKNEGVITSLDVNMISKKILEISSWDSSLRKRKGEKLKNFIDKYYGIENISKKYLPLYDEISPDKVFHKKMSIFEFLINLMLNNNFLQISLSYIFNFTIPTLLMLFLTLKGKSSLAADLAIVSSIFITLTQIFSSNMKVQIITNNNINLARSVYQFRCLFSLSILLIFQYFILMSNFFEEENKLILLIMVLIILTQWIGEINLALEEINSKLSYFIFYNFLNITMCIFHISIIFSELNILTYSLIIHLILLMISFLFNKNELHINWNFKNIYDSFSKNLRTLAFLSSLSIIFSSLFWRIVIYAFFTKPVAAIYFACFAIGSFPGSTFNIAIGPTYIKQKILLSKKYKLFLSIIFITLLIACIIAGISVYKNLNLALPNKYFIVYTFAYSSLGAFFMTYAMYKRQYLLQQIKNKSLNIFLIDIVYGGSISILCPLLFFIGGAYAVSLTFFFSSILALLMYSSILVFMKDNNVSST
jgi:glycosyltransferase involved in cell wall biosynthesis